MPEFTREDEETNGISFFYYFIWLIYTKSLFHFFDDTKEYINGMELVKWAFIKI